MTEEDEHNLNPEEQNEKMLAIYRPILSKIPVSLSDGGAAKANSVSGSSSSSSSSSSSAGDEQFIYICSELPISSEKLLKEEGITHIVNAAGDVVPNGAGDGKEFPGIEYLTYYYKDGRGEDISSGFFRTLDFVESAYARRGSKAKVIFHCSQGVSRSATLAIMFLMLRSRMPMAQILQILQDRYRKIVKPNMAFLTQLLLWQKDLGIGNHVPEPKLFRVRVHSEKKKILMLYQQDHKATGQLHLDPRFTYVV